jgi:catechol 2,3-dioxygenase-like lactoylglutathione lyase family enzyme
MARVQLGLNVTDIDEAVSFYSRMFGTEPAKRRPGYANFAIADPPLKLVLFEVADRPGALNHLGVEVESSDDVEAAQRRLTDQGIETGDEKEVTCCYAKQDKVWIQDPDGEPWEFYTVLDDAPNLVPEGAPDGTCCM